MKYSLTGYERALAIDPEVMFAKSRIIKKVYEMFGVLAEAYAKQVIPFNVQPLISAKISRGENYLGLPYVMLDYPRQFGKPDIFAIRTFFWWGNFFSITLQLAGSYQKEYGNKLQETIYKGLLDEWFITSSDNAWHHSFDEGYYSPIDKTIDYRFGNLPFIKVATKIPLAEWDEADRFLTGNFDLLMQSLH